MQTSSDKKISICIATYNMKFFLARLIASIYATYKPISWEREIILYDDCSTDGTAFLPWLKDYPEIKYIRGDRNVGVGDAFNNAIDASTGEIVVLMCADDIIIYKDYFESLVKEFREPMVGHITRNYYQFVNMKEDVPVRAWRSENPLVQANNPSGLAFRRKALEGCKCSNKMFIETTELVKKVLENGWAWKKIDRDVIAVRVHDSTSTRREYWLKRRVSSPVQDWYDLGCEEMTTDYVSLIQIKNGFTTEAVFEEIGNFLRLRPANWFSIRFWFWAIVAVITPRQILRGLPKFYRRHIGPVVTRRRG